MLDELRFLKYFLRIRAEHPIYLLFFITSRCMGRCRHCFYWRSLNQKENALSLEEIEKVSKNMGRLLQLTITGGEPLLREDLAEIFQIFYQHNQPFNFGLATSGYYPERLEKVMKEVLSSCPESNFTAGLPVEGLKELNDYIRGVPGAFEKTQESFKLLKELKRHYSQLTILVDITASGFNQDHLKETYEMLRDDWKPDIINLIITRGEPREEDAREISPKKIREIISLMESDIRSGKIPGYGFNSRVLHGKDILVRRLALEIFEGKSPRLKCRAGDLIGVIYPEGQVYPCELWSEMIGNLRKFDYDIKRLWGSEKAGLMRKAIVERNCQCYHQCFLSPSIFFDQGYLVKMLKGMF